MPPYQTPEELAAADAEAFLRRREDDDALPDHVPPQYRRLVTETAQRHGVPARLLSDLILKESSWRDGVRSPAGAVGLMQLMPGTARDLRVNPRDPAQNVDGGTRYLKQQFDRFGSWDKALQAYNAGPGAVQAGRVPRETQNYVRNLSGSIPKGVPPGAPQGATKGAPKVSVETVPARASLPLRNPEVRSAFLRVKDRAKRELGVDIVLTSGDRSHERQKQLWRGRAKNPFPVARPGTSNHEHGLAVDLNVFRNGKKLPESVVAQIAAEEGFQWLGERDRVHFDYRGRGQLASRGRGSDRAVGDSRRRIAAAIQGGRPSLPALPQMDTQSLTPEELAARDAAAFLEQTQRRLAPSPDTPGAADTPEALAAADAQAFLQRRTGTAPRSPSLPDGEYYTEKGIAYRLKPGPVQPGRGRPREAVHGVKFPGDGHYEVQQGKVYRITAAPQRVPARTPAPPDRQALEAERRSLMRQSADQDALSPKAARRLRELNKLLAAPAPPTYEDVAGKRSLNPFTGERVRRPNTAERIRGAVLPGPERILGAATNSYRERALRDEVPFVQFDPDERTARAQQRKLNDLRPLIDQFERSHVREWERQKLAPHGKDPLAGSPFGTAHASGMVPPKTVYPPGVREKVAKEAAARWKHLPEFLRKHGKTLDPWTAKAVAATAAAREIWHAHEREYDETLTREVLSQITAQFLGGAFGQAATRGVAAVPMLAKAPPVVRSFIGHATGLSASGAAENVLMDVAQNPKAPLKQRVQAAGAGAAVSLGIGGVTTGAGALLRKGTRQAPALPAETPAPRTVPVTAKPAGAPLGKPIGKPQARPGGRSVPVTAKRTPVAVEAAAVPAAETAPVRPIPEPLRKAGYVPGAKVRLKDGGTGTLLGASPDVPGTLRVDTAHGPTDFRAGEFRLTGQVAPAAAKPRAAPETPAPSPRQRLEVDAEAQRLGMTPPVPAPARKPRVETVPLAELRVDPERFQYKLATNREGVTPELKGVQKWDPNKAGVVLAWKDPADGKTYIVNGHHRYELAKRLGVSDLDVRLVDAADAGEARTIGALTNIAEGRGTAVDAAKVFREKGLTPDQLAEEGVSLRGKVAADGLALSRLDDGLWQQVATGKLPVSRGVALGAALSDPAEQRALAALLAKREQGGRRVADEVVTELARQVKAAGKTTVKTTSLFGEEEITQSNAVERAELTVWLKGQLSQDKRLFGFVAKSGRAAKLSEAGNVIDVEASAGRAAESAQVAEVFDRLAVTKGPISDLLNAAAARIAKGENPDVVRRQLLTGVKVAAEKAAGGLKPADPGASPPAGAEEPPGRGRGGGAGGKGRRAAAAQSPDGQSTPVPGANADAAPSTSPRVQPAVKQKPDPSAPPKAATQPKATRETAPDQGAVAAPGKAPELTAELQATREAALERIRSRRGRLQAGLDPEDLYDYAVVGATYIAEGAIRFDDWSRRMLAELGEEIREHLDELWQAARRYYDSEYVARRNLPQFLDDTDPNAVPRVDGTEVGPHGPIFRGFRYNAQGAIRQLRNIQTGEAIAALHHRDIGDIDLVWGEEGTGPGSGHGLAKILARHPEIVDDLQGHLDRSDMMGRRGHNRILGYDEYRFIVSEQWRGQQKNWLLTGFRRANPPGPGGMVGGPGGPAPGGAGPAGRQAPPPPGGLVPPSIQQGAGSVNPRGGASAAGGAGPEYAASINLDKYAVSDEVKQLVRESVASQESAITAQRRGTRAVETTNRAATLLLNSGAITAEKLKGLKPGTALNADELRAAATLHARLLEEVHDARRAYASQDSTENLARLTEAMTRYQAVERAFAGAATEAGRALAILKEIRTAYRGSVERRVAELFDPEAAPNLKPEPPRTRRTQAGTPSFGADNRVFTLARATAARERLLKKAGRASSGIDPSLLPDLVEVGGYYVEGGLRTFARWSAQMKADLGDLLDDAQLRTLWERLRPEAARRLQAQQRSLQAQDLARRRLTRVLKEQGRELDDATLAQLLAAGDDPVQLSRVLQAHARETFTQRLQRETAEVLNVPRALMSSFDMSAPFRQGLVLTASRPKQAVAAAGAMVRAFFSEGAFQRVATELRERPNADLYQTHGLYQAKRSDELLTAREEAFMSRLLQRIPVVGAGTKASERAYLTYLNRLRADVFDHLAAEFQRGGLDPVRDSKTFDDLARYINLATGRGDLGPLEKAAPLLNGIFFSPRFMAARISLLNPATYAKLSPRVRAQALRDMILFTGTGLTVLGLARLAGSQVEADPRSSDFGKIRIGETRIDVWGGFQQYLRYGAQFAAGERKTTAGAVKKLDRLELPSRFVRSKLAPGPAFFADLAQGKNIIGEKFRWEEQAEQRLLPIYVQDLKKLYREHGLAGAAGFSVPAFFGVGVSTYKK